MPIRWSELNDPELAPDRWNLANIEKRLREDDPWAGGNTRGRSVRAADRRLSARTAEPTRQPRPQRWRWRQHWVALPAVDVRR